MGPWYSGNTSRLQREAASSTLAGSTSKNRAPALFLVYLKNFYFGPPKIKFFANPPTH